MQLELISSKKSEGSCLKITTSFYRPFLDGGYKSMISNMMDSGCFDDFIKAILEYITKSGID